MPTDLPDPRLPRWLLALVHAAAHVRIDLAIAAFRLSEAARRRGWLRCATYLGMIGRHLLRRLKRLS